MPARAVDVPRRGALARFGTALGALGAEGTAAWIRPALGAALAAADVIIPAVVALILLTVILRGSTETCERAFRLLRWIAARPEPPAPPNRTVAGARSR